MCIRDSINSDSDINIVYGIWCFEIMISMDSDSSEILGKQCVNLHSIPKYICNLQMARWLLHILALPLLRIASQYKNNTIFLYTFISHFTPTENVNAVKKHYVQGDAKL